MKNTTISSKAVKMDVIVLENLFYSKKFSQVFDLKGSERNRMVNEKHLEKDIVLLDENFLRCKIKLNVLINLYFINFICL